MRAHGGFVARLMRSRLNLDLFLHRLKGVTNIEQLNYSKSTARFQTCKVTRNESLF